MVKKIFISIISMLLLGTMCFSMVACSNAPIKEEPNKIVDTGGFVSKFVNTENVELFAATPMSMSKTTNTASQTLTATVYPTTATNKKVDWSVAWGQSNSANVTDYVKVVPTSDGSTTATVTCYKAFTGDIIVTVTTRESGYTAECIVTFVGIPTDIEIQTSASSNADGYSLGVGSSYVFTPVLSNPFGSVGDNYKNLKVTLTGIGSVVLGTFENYSSTGSSKWYEDSLKTVSLDSLKDNFITVTYSNGVINVTTKKTIESYYGSIDRIDGGRTQFYEDKFKEFASDCYFKVTVNEPVSGVYTSFNIRFNDTVVTSVSTNKTQIYF